MEEEKINPPAVGAAPDPVVLEQQLKEIEKYVQENLLQSPSFNEQPATTSEAAISLELSEEAEVAGLGDLPVEFEG
jgi:hypothetical protein